MKPTTTVAEFIRRGREARQDALGIANDPEALVAIAAVYRETFLRERGEPALRSWRQLVAEIARAGDPDPAMERWLAIEHVRLGGAFDWSSLEDLTLPVDAASWISKLDVHERDEVMSRFTLDLMAPLTVAAAGSRG